MRIFCYGKSEARQKARCDFFLGAGCSADWATGLEEALYMLTYGRYDAIILGPTVSASDRDYIHSQMMLVHPSAAIFTLTTCAGDPIDEPEYALELPGILSKLQDLRSNRRA
jgi:hypothetical protein